MLLGFSLDVFDKSVKDYLDSLIRKLGYDPQELFPLIEVAIGEAKKSASEDVEELAHKRGVPIALFMRSITLTRSIIKEYAYAYIYGVLAQAKKFKSAYESICSYSSIFLVGAGLSFESGIPLTSVLNDLLELYAKNYDELRRDKQKCKSFKLEFKRICYRKKVGTSHRLIALNFPEHILEIICLNWDNLIEMAARALGKEIPKINEDVVTTGERYLWKFHGDVENIKDDNIKGKGGWVFPDEKGYVFNNFFTYIKEKGLLGIMFTFVIVGYSEREKEIYDGIIKTFGEKRPTFRVGLDLERLHDKNYIVGPADFILKKILPLQL